MDLCRMNTTQNIFFYLGVHNEILLDLIFNSHAKSSISLFCEGWAGGKFKTKSSLICQFSVIN